MKKQLYIALGAGAAIAGFAAYMLTRRKRNPANAVALPKNERTHLTDVFAKAKKRTQSE